MAKKDLDNASTSIEVEIEKIKAEIARLKGMYHE